MARARPMARLGRPASRARRVARALPALALLLLAAAAAVGRAQELPNPAGAAAAAQVVTVGDVLALPTTSTTSTTSSSPSPSPSARLRVNEVYAAGGADWVEVHNPGPDLVALGGWGLSDDPAEPMKLRLPLATPPIPDGGYFAVSLADAGFGLDAAGETVYLTSPAGVTVAELAYPAQLAGHSYGVPWPEPADGRAAFLRKAPDGTAGSPGARNAAADPDAFALADATRAGVAARAGRAVPVCATVRHVGRRPKVQLVFWTLGSGNMAMDMAPRDAAALAELRAAGSPWVPAGDGLAEDETVFCGSVPGQYVQQGMLLKWYVKARPAGGDAAQRELGAQRLPPAAEADSPRYFGALVGPARGTSGLPVLDVFVANVNRLMNASDKAEHQAATVVWGGELYDNVRMRKRGQTTLSWPKPKFKLDFKGEAFRLMDHFPRMEEINLQSYYDELGDLTYARENVAAQVFQESGVLAPAVFYLELRLNGQFYGLYSFVEQVDDNFLRRHGLSPAGPLYKAWHGYQSNLRYDVPPTQMQWAYRKGNLKDVAVGSGAPGSYDDLQALTLGLVGKGPPPSAHDRATFLYDHVDLPSVVNEMAAQTLMLNKDRCVKNFYMYLNPKTEEWLRIPWDFEQAFGISHDLGNEPALDSYCDLACEQFNSPLFCDSEHSQDVPGWVHDDWGRRRLAFLDAWWGGGDSGPYEWECESPGPDGTGCFEGRSARGANGNFNYLVDAVLDVPSTRAMYLRRLKSLMDQFLDGRLLELFTDAGAYVQRVAAKDDRRWGRGDIAVGLAQIQQEQLPRRREQLVNTYSVGGRVAPGEIHYPLIPGDSQARRPDVKFQDVRFPASAADREFFVELRNRAAAAVDLTGFRVLGAVDHVFKPGTVVPAGKSLFLSPDVRAFRARRTGPRRGQRRFVQGPIDSALPVGGEGEWELLLYNAEGEVVHKLEA